MTKSKLVYFSFFIAGFVLALFCARVDLTRLMQDFSSEELGQRGEAKGKNSRSQYSIFGKTYTIKQSSAGFVEEGVASWYGEKFHGRKTSSGEVYDMYQMTAAHPTLPLPTFVKVTNQRNQKSVIVKINDRGPFVKGRVIDLSYAAAAKLDMIREGTSPVLVQALPVHAYQKSVEHRSEASERHEVTRQVTHNAAKQSASGAYGVGEVIFYQERVRSAPK